jgi:hypothetical protein
MADQLLMEHRGARLDFCHMPHTRIDTLDHLRAMAQLAIQIELTTIPAYLTTLYSISDRTSDAYQTVRSVVVEEMFHLNQAANLLVGIGGRPVLTGAAVPLYPAYLPSADKAETPYVGLYRGSPAVFRNVFMVIETPAPFTAPPEGENYQTIAQFYKALWDGICLCVARFGEAAVFRQDPAAEQRTDLYLGKFGGRPVAVTSKDTAWDGIVQIIQQGEGAVDPTRTIVPTQPFGAYGHYGLRTDGTYGPILGTPYELSHYYKFMAVANAPNFPDTLPIVSNPRRSEFVNPEALKALDAFNTAYSVMLKSFETVFSSGAGDNDVFFKSTLPIMCDGLPALASLLMTTPVFADGDASVGPNAAPTFEYVEQPTLGAVIATLDELGAAPIEAGVLSAPGKRSALARTAAGRFRKLQQMCAASGFVL